MTELEALMFPDQAAIDRCFAAMRLSLDMIETLAGDPSPEAIDVVARNKEYLATCLTYQPIQDAGVDLSPFNCS